jgi:hypothetical protein
MATVQPHRHSERVTSGGQTCIGPARGAAYWLSGCLAMIIVAASVPTLLVSGAAGYLLYNAVMFVFATPFNELFLFYDAMLSLVVWSVLAVVQGIDVDTLARRSPHLPVRGVAVYIWVIVGMNTLVWLRAVVPAVLDDEPTAFLSDTGLTTNPAYVGSSPGGCR